VKRPDETPVQLLLRAVTFAAERHKSQLRKNAEATPYINHPIAVAELLAREGQVDDVVVLAAAVLHDTIEDTQTTREEVQELFGADVAGVVAEVTDDKTLRKEERKRLQIEHAPHLTRRAKLVKLADKICNVRDVADDPPKDWPLQRRQEYFDWAKAVIDGLRGANGPLEAKFDALFARRPA
jgi:GTP diphosphokinase / guanosine-3',5'-bis(diphosphate) 3'-diphosphatase